MSAPAAAPRFVWMIIAFAMMMATVMYAVVLVSIHPGQAQSPGAEAPPRILFWISAAVVAIASLGHTQFRLRRPIQDAAASVPPGPLMEPAEFQSRSVVSLALAEAVCVLGFVQAMLHHTSVTGYIPFGLVALVVIAADTIPVGLSYWQEWERRQQAGGP